MAKKDNNTQPSLDPRTDARGIMLRLHVGEIWYTTDGQWFTDVKKAQAHTAGTDFEIKHYKLKRF